METFMKIFQWLLTAPRWMRVLMPLLAAIAISAVLLSSCGQVLRVTVRDTPNGVSITTSQNKSDSTATNININPNISFPNVAH